MLVEVLYDLLEMRIRSAATPVAKAPARTAGPRRMFSPLIMLKLSI
jgi:hypothetical protein